MGFCFLRWNTSGVQCGGHGWQTAKPKIRKWVVKTMYCTDRFAWNYTKSPRSSGLCHDPGFSLDFNGGGISFASSNRKIEILDQKSAWTSFFEIMKSQAFPVFDVKSSIGELCGCMAMATLCWFFNFEIFWNFHFRAFWTCHHTLPNLRFYWKKWLFLKYDWNDLRKNEFLNLFEMIWKRKPCA